jgi:hypothetical protein
MRLLRSDNAKQVRIICAQRKGLNRLGHHICAVMSETATRLGARVMMPLMSQAAGQNFPYGGRVWCTGAQFARLGF